MAQTNRNRSGNVGRSHEGASAVRQTAEQELRRAVLSCMLFEDTFYESGTSIADRIASLAKRVSPETVAALAVEARQEYNLRHAPLWLLLALLHDKKNNKLVRKALPVVISRVDEIAEFLSMYLGKAAGNRGVDNPPMPHQMLLGLADAFRKFDEYQFGKYRGEGKAISLKDAIRIVRPVPYDRDQSKLFNKIAHDKLDTPDTWETKLSSGADKRATFERLMEEGRLGAMATLRNLRGMLDAGVKSNVISQYLLGLDVSRILPFRFFSAAKAAPEFEPELEQLMFRSLEFQPKLHGKTVICVDTSGSMGSVMSAKSRVRLVEAAATLATMAREVSDDVAMLAFATGVAPVAPRRGFALSEQFYVGKVGHGTDIDLAVKTAVSRHPDMDRLIIVTDVQSRTDFSLPQGVKGYILNVAPYQPSVGYGRWVRIDGFSSAVLKWIAVYEDAFDFS